MSHTVKTTIEFRDAAALQRVIERLGGRWLGQGEHQLYGSNRETGLGMTLPGWAYPLVLTGHRLASDAYRQTGGASVDEITRRYAIEVARSAAEAQGWYCEMQGEDLLVYHPDGGTLTVTGAGEVDASGWQGAGCARAALTLGEALGAAESITVKPEYLQEQARIREVGAS